MGNKKHIKLQRSKMNRSELDQVYLHPTKICRNVSIRQLFHPQLSRRKILVFWGLLLRLIAKGKVQDVGLHQIKSGKLVCREILNA